MASGALTQAQIEAAIAALNEGMASGELKIAYADRTVTYRSVADLLTALNYYEEQLATCTGRDRALNTRLVTGKGFAT